MITKVRLENFRCFEDHTIPLRQLSVIVGQNNAGKSSFVDALRLIALVTNRYRRLQVRAAPRGLDVPKAYKGVTPSIEGIDVTFDTVFHRYNDPPAVVTASFSSGESIRSYMFVARTDARSSVILDEPDVYLHADLQRKLIRLIRKRYQQTLVATHSVEMMAEVEPENVLVIDRRRAESRFASSLPAVQRVVERIGDVHNLHLARLWSSRECLLVEGKDIAIMRRWQSALFPETTEPLDALPNVSIGGWGGWPYAIGSSLLLRNAGGETIRVYCVLDRDYHPSQEIERRLQEAKQRGVQLHIWARKEIENYLLVPPGIARVISELKRSSGAGPSGEEVAKCLSRLADGLKDECLDALAVEFHRLDKAGGIARANRLARERVDQAWQTLEGRIGPVSGKQLLSNLSAWSQATHGVSLNSVRLAASLSSDEILPEVAGVLRRIEGAAPLGSDE